MSLISSIMPSMDEHSVHWEMCQITQVFCNSTAMNSALWYPPQVWIHTAPSPSSRAAKAARLQQEGEQNGSRSTCYLQHHKDRGWSLSSVSCWIRLVSLPAGLKQKAAVLKELILPGTTNLRFLRNSKAAELGFLLPACSCLPCLQPDP